MIRKNIAATVLVMAAGMAFAGAAHASEELAKKSNCLACHAVDKKLVGPAYKEIAAKYKATKGADTMLAGKIKAGGSGVWGAIPMPPNAVSDADALALAKWVLAQ